MSCDIEVFVKCVWNHFYDKFLTLKEKGTCLIDVRTNDVDGETVKEILNKNSDFYFLFPYSLPEKDY